MAELQNNGSRPLNEFEAALSEYFSPRQWQNIQNAQVGIAGAGGLGSNIAVALVRSGVRRLEIVDFDIIEAKNLNRQYYFLDEVGRPKVDVLRGRLLTINPAAEVRIHRAKLTDENISDYFKSADYIIEAFDRPEAKRLFLETFAASGKFLVMGSGMAGIANENPIAILKLKESLYLVGDGVTAVGNENPPCAPRVSACAGLMASVVLEHVCGK